MVSRVGVVSDDFRKQVLGYGLTTAEILYRMPDHPSLLQTYVWQNYDLFPKFRHSRISSPLAGKTRCSTR